MATADSHRPEPPCQPEQASVAPDALDHRLGLAALLHGAVLANPSAYPCDRDDQVRYAADLVQRIQTGYWNATLTPAERRQREQRTAHILHGLVVNVRHLDLSDSRQASLLVRDAIDRERLGRLTDKVVNH